ncbi:MAG: hypothetical protein RLZZ41_110 [Actinomycetota bacterium]|jgi:uncharacterized protein YoxC
MSVSELASLVAAGGFVLLVLLLAVPILKLGKLIDRSSESLVEITEELTPLVSELTVTLEETNRQLKKFDGISTDVAQVTKSFATMVAAFSASIGGPLAKIAGVAEVVRKLVGKRK